MPMSQPEMERNIVRNTNDIESIYDLLSGIDSTLTEHTGRFDAMDGRFDAIDGRFDGIDARLAMHDGRFDGIDARLAMHDGRFDGIDARLETLDTNAQEILRRLPG